MSVVSVVFCQVEVSETSRSIVQRSPLKCGASLCVIQKLKERDDRGPCWAVAPDRQTDRQTDKQTEQLQKPGFC